MCPFIFHNSKYFESAKKKDFLEFYDNTQIKAIHFNLNALSIHEWKLSLNNSGVHYS